MTLPKYITDKSFHATTGHGESDRAIKLSSLESLYNRIRAEAVREFGEWLFAENPWRVTTKAEIADFADRIERGG